MKSMDALGLKRLIPYIMRYRLKVFSLLLLAVASALLTLLPIQLIALMVDVLSSNTNKILVYFPWLNHVYVLFFVFVLTYALARFTENIYSHFCMRVSDSILRDVRQGVFESAISAFEIRRQPISPTDVAARIANDADWITRALGGPMNALVPQMLRLIFALTYMFSINWLLGITCVIIVVPLFFLSKWIAVLAKQIAMDQRKASAHLLEIVNEVFGKLPIIRAFQTEKTETHFFGQSNTRVKELSLTLSKKFTIYWVCVYSVMLIGYSFGIFFSISSVQAGALSAGAIAVTFQYMSSVFGPIASISRFGNDLMQADSALKRLFALSPSESTALQYSSANLKTEATNLRVVDLSYEIGNERLLSSLSFEASKNTITVIRGSSGIGKTTLLYTLIGLYPKIRGEIWLDDDRIEDMELLSRSNISFQQPFLFNRSVQENIAYGDSSPDESRIHSLLRKMSLHFLLNEDRVHELVGVDGANLSGGERRRVSIARALYRGQERGLYFFDEPTAEVDEETQAAILEVLLSLRDQATVVLITHDPAILAIADQVVDLDSFVDGFSK